MMKIDIGIKDDDREKIAEGLSRVLAETYTVYLKTHNYHWNVTGPMFQTLHTMFEEQYTELATAVDLIAERIRSLGHFAPGSFSQFQKLSSVEESSQVPRAMEMVKDLVQSHERIAKTAREVLQVSDSASDEATTDLLTQRLDLHEKTAWMLRSLAAEG